LERKLRKNAPCLNQSAISNFALYVIKNISPEQGLQEHTCVFAFAPSTKVKLLTEIATPAFEGRQEWSEGRRNSPASPIC